MKNEDHGYRKIVGVYEITQDTLAARSIARANTDHGDGGLEQFFVPDWETSTTRIGEIQLVDP